MPDITSDSVEIASGSIQGGSINGAQLNNCSGVMVAGPLRLRLTLNEPLTVPNLHISGCVYSIDRGILKVDLITSTQIELTPTDSQDGTPLEGQPFSFIVYKLGPR